MNLNENKKTGFTQTISGKEIQVICPKPIISDIDVFPYKHKMHPQLAIDALLDGNFVLIFDFYSSGLSVLRELKTHLEKKHKDQSFKSQREFRSEFRELSNKILLHIKNNKLQVKKAPEIGWFKILYPDFDEFLLSFPQVQGLNSSWQWYVKGISIPVLNSKIQPFFGTYFPTRFEHLTLFDKWLKQYKGEKNTVFDIGIGSGILTYQLLKNGFKKVFATDSNPNAIIGVYENILKTKLETKIDLQFGDLFANFDFKCDLIVFNPPWLPASHNLEGIDKAIYYDQDLFPRFFAEAQKHLNAEGKLVLIFSNLGQLTNSEEKHPIETELLNETRFEKEIFLQSAVSAASKNTKRNQHWRSSEMVELWVLKLKK